MGTENIFYNNKIEIMIITGVCRSVLYKIRSIFCL